MNHLEQHHGRKYVIPDTEIVDDEDIIDEIVDKKVGFWKTVKSIFVSDKKIGELNGKWAAMLKMVLIIVILTVPSFFAWATWVTNEIYTNKNHRITTEEYGTRLIELETNLKILNRVEADIARIAAKVETLPPPDWRRRVEVLESSNAELKEDVSTLDKNNSTDHTKLGTILEHNKALLEKISSQLEVIKK